MVPLFFSYRATEANYMFSAYVCQSFHCLFYTRVHCYQSVYDMKMFVFSDESELKIRKITVDCFLRGILIAVRVKV